MKFIINSIQSIARRARAAYHKLMAALLLAAVGMHEANAQGAANAARSLTNSVNAFVTLLIAVGVLAGLGFIAAAGFAMYKKSSDRGGDEVGWMGIVMKFAAGAVLLSLSFMGVMSVETLGGSAGNVGRQF